MSFIFGYITGLLTAILIFLILAYFRAGIEKKVKIIETTVSNAGPRPKGGIFLPEDEADIERNEIIAKNKEMGRDTHIDELR